LEHGSTALGEAFIRIDNVWLQRGKPLKISLQFSSMEQKVDFGAILFATDAMSLSWTCRRH
jgi:hypothetical protein